MIRWVVNLRDPAGGDARLVGGKAAQLSRLMQAGLPVPEAFVVTTDAFREHFPTAAPGDAPSAPALQRPLAQAVNAALGSQFAAETYLAVRSSALAEDGTAASYAGQHETYYYVAPDRIAGAVVDCWLSLWSARADSYRAGHGSPSTGDFAMAVIVQRMVAAESSGVCFTADPLAPGTGNAVIEATWGLGAALVDGRVSPDRLVLNRAGVVQRHHVGRKRHKVAATLHRPQETRLEPVPLFQQTRPALTDDQAREVVSLSLRAEALSGPPQDVEWAFESGSLFLLQSRPITTLPAAAAPDRDSRPGSQQRSEMPPGGRWVLFKPLAENFTGPLTPMTIDLFRRVLPPGGRFIDGRYYLSLDLARGLCPFRWTDAELTDAMLLRGNVPSLGLDWRKAPVALLALAVAYLADGIAWHRSAHLTRASLGQYATQCQQLRRSGAHEILSVFRRLVLGRHPFEPIGRMAYYLNVSAGRYFLLLGLLTKLVERWAPDLDPHQLSPLCSGDGGTFSRQMVEGVRDLAEVAREDPALAARLTEDNSPGLSEVLASLPHDHPFTQALQDYLEIFGHRCMREMELAVPRWREDPLPVLLMVRGYLRAPSSSPGDAHALHLLARDALRRALPRPWQRRVADYLIRRVRYYTSLREDTRHYHAMAMEITRSNLLDLEQTLIARGRLRLPGDVFYLTWDEARALEAGDLDWHDVADRLRLRRRRERAAVRAGAPEIFNGHGTETVTAIAPAGATTTLTGQCASGGSAEGRVRVVLDPATAHDLEAGDILVAPYTDPAWTPLFPLAAAVIVEVGSFLSHAGTVAREYGIPCLVDVAHCTTVLRDGQRIRVVADQGRVELLEPAP